MGGLVVPRDSPKARCMEPKENNPHRLENFQAHRHACELAVRTLQLLDRSQRREGNVLGEVIIGAALRLAGELARSHALPAEMPEKRSAQRDALSMCAQLESHLLLARDAKLLSGHDCAQLAERLTSTRMLIHGLLRAQARERPTVKPSSPGPSRRPPSSGGGSRGGDLWDSRS